MRNLFIKSRPSLLGNKRILALLGVGLTLWLLLRSPELQEPLPWTPPIEPHGLVITKNESVASAPAMVAKSKAATPSDDLPLSSKDSKVIHHPVASGQEVTPRVASAIDRDDQVRKVVEEWRRSWSAQDIDTYFRQYSNSFMPPVGHDRTSWEKNRRQRIQSKKRITVELSEMKIALDGSKATVQFKQTYIADNLRSVGPKTLRLVQEGGRWLIVSEVSS